MSGVLVVLSGPSGVGKDTLIDAWSKRNPRVCRVVTYTTREPRTGETDGVSYHFVDRETFFELAKNNRFFEHKNVFEDDWYASPRDEAERLVESGMVAILKIDVEGALEVMKERPDALTVFILPPSREELERRIRSRARDDVAAIEQRLSKAQRELSYARRYAYRIVNDDPERAVDRLESMLAEFEGLESARADDRPRGVR